MKSTIWNNKVREVIESENYSSRVSEHPHNWESRIVWQFASVVLVTQLDLLNWKYGNSH